MLLLVELLLVFGAAFGWGGWELWTLRRERLKDEAKRHQERAAQAPGD